MKVLVFIGFIVALSELIGVCMSWILAFVSDVVAPLAPIAVFIMMIGLGVMVYRQFKRIMNEH